VIGGDPVLNEMNDIVLVDDNPTLLGVLSEIFKTRGYTVRTASDGFAALAAIRERVPNVLLSDLYMPGMSGFELLSVVRRRFTTIAVIAMSGAYSGGSVPAGVAADGFYAKGSCSIAGLFEILSAIEDKAVLQSTRAAAPIWIPGLPIRQRDLSTMAVACPECLRPFSHSPRDEAFVEQESDCPHCLRSVRLAIVRPSEEMDKTALPLSTIATRTSESIFASYTSSNRYSEISSR
jgi:CheY-like chemotaxis protein